jgi:aryl-alcohol dehydrogenase-like predicted oxidoreductase
MVEAAQALEKLRAKGKIRQIGVTNFDMKHLKMITDAGVTVISQQLQYSLIDDRATHGMAEFCRERGIGLFCYGTVLGGFLSERWLGKPDPKEDFTNRSLIKYKLIIDDFGGWDLFQRLLRQLDKTAKACGCDIATLGSRLMLDRPQVAAVIIGATNRSHLDSHRDIDKVAVPTEDRVAIDAILAERGGPEGDIYDLERDREGRHGRIIKYNLNKAAPQ